MALVQTHFRGRLDTEGLNSDSFEHGLDESWVQEADKTFRIRFAIQGSGVVGGTLEASLDGGGFEDVTATSGTAVAAASLCFGDGDPTTALLPGETFVPGTGSHDGVAESVTLDDSYTEIEYAVRALSSGTLELRIAGLTYEQTPSLQVSALTAVQKVRLLIGDSSQLTDDEVLSFVAAWPSNTDMAAGYAAEAIAAKYADGYDFTTDGQSFDRSQRVAHYMQIARNLKAGGGQFVWP